MSRLSGLCCESELNQSQSSLVVSPRLGCLSLLLALPKQQHALVPSSFKLPPAHRAPQFPGLSGRGYTLVSLALSLALSLAFCAYFSPLSLSQVLRIRWRPGLVSSRFDKRLLRQRSRRR